ncbi:MAG: beta-lactamase family protein [Saprospiraceae bacterium]|nr:beta-lactamase family protein [Saprospiraceae bacterium]
MLDIRRIVLPLLVIWLALACSNGGDKPIKMGATMRPTPPLLDPAFEAMLHDYNRFFEDSMILTMTPGAAVVVVKDGEVVFIKGYGVRQEGSQLAIDENTVFRIGSLSKGFASILAGKLEDENKLRWYDKVQHYVPEFNLSDPAQAQRVEVKNIVTQTIGLPYHSFSNLIEQGFSKAYILSQFPLARLAGKEGEYFSYQNAAYSLIEPVIEQASGGKPFGELLASELFEPLQMHSASSTYDAIVNSQNHALPHRFRGVGWEPDSITHRYYNYTAAGGVNASISDMAEWLKALLGHKPEVVPQSVLRDVFTPHITSGRERPVLRGFIDRDSAYYGKGWRILHHWGDTLVYHAGFVNNYLSEIAFLPSDDIGICVLFNCPSQLGGQAISTFFRRWRTVRELMKKPPLS